MSRITRPFGLPAAAPRGRTGPRPARPADEQLPPLGGRPVVQLGPALQLRMMLLEWSRALYEWRIRDLHAIAHGQPRPPIHR